MRLLNAIHRYDVVMFFWLINTNSYRRLARICRYISCTGDGELYVLLIATLYWQYGWQNSLLQALVMAFCLERPLYFILKNSFRRNRPAAAINDFQSLVKPSDKFSFPSGHTSAAFMVALLISGFLPVLLIPLCVWAAAIGISRVVLGVHFPTDILVGCLMGSSIAVYSLSQVG
jgi:undecaprenyl-diphosphatase